MSTESTELTESTGSAESTGSTDSTPAVDAPPQPREPSDPLVTLDRVATDTAVAPDDQQQQQQKKRHAAGRRTAEAPEQPAPTAMEPQLRQGIGVGLLVLSALLIAHLLWAWSFASKLVGLETGQPRPVRVHWLWLSFSPSVDWALLLVVTLAAAAGSTAHTALIFANRAGHAKLEGSWAFWYVLRPGASAVIGVLTYIIVKAGFLGTVNDGDGKGLAFAAAVGALSGMFTDTLIAKLRGALGASPFNVAASAGSAAKDTGGEAEGE
jgi:drug/metabolite transporter superfamily protein YnfA